VVKFFLLIAPLGVFAQTPSLVSPIVPIAKKGPPRMDDYSGNFIE
jgi:hypothetical protein